MSREQFTNDPQFESFLFSNFTNATYSAVEATSTSSGWNPWNMMGSALKVGGAALAMVVTYNYRNLIKDAVAHVVTHNPLQDHFATKQRIKELKADAKQNPILNLELGEALEKQGNHAAAVFHYQQVPNITSIMHTRMKQHLETPAVLKIFNATLPLLNDKNTGGIVFQYLTEPFGELLVKRGIYTPRNVVEHFPLLIKSAELGLALEYTLAIPEVNAYIVANSNTERLLIHTMQQDFNKFHAQGNYPAIFFDQLCEFICSAQAPGNRQVAINRLDVLDLFEKAYAEHVLQRDGKRISSIEEWFNEAEKQKKDHAEKRRWIATALTEKTQASTTNASAGAAALTTSALHGVDYSVDVYHARKDKVASEKQQAILTVELERLDKCIQTSQLRLGKLKERQHVLQFELDKLPTTVLKQKSKKRKLQDQISDLKKQLEEFTRKKPTDETHQLISNLNKQLIVLEKEHEELRKLISMRKPALQQELRILQIEMDGEQQQIQRWQELQKNIQIQIPLNFHIPRTKELYRLYALYFLVANKIDAVFSEIEKIKELLKTTQAQLKVLREQLEDTQSFTANPELFKRNAMSFYGCNEQQLKEYIPQQLLLLFDLPHSVLEEHVRAMQQSVVAKEKEVTALQAKQKELTQQSTLYNQFYSTTTYNLGLVLIELAGYFKDHATHYLFLIGRAWNQMSQSIKFGTPLKIIHLEDAKKQRNHIVAEQQRVRKILVPVEVIEPSAANTPNVSEQKKEAAATKPLEKKPDVKATAPAKKDASATVPPPPLPVVSKPTMPDLVELQKIICFKEGKDQLQALQQYKKIIEDKKPLTPEEFRALSSQFVKEQKFLAAQVHLRLALQDIRPKINPLMAQLQGISFIKEKIKTIDQKDEKRANQNDPQNLLAKNLANLAIHTCLTTLGITPPCATQELLDNITQVKALVDQKETTLMKDFEKISKTYYLALYQLGSTLEKMAVLDEHKDHKNSLLHQAKVCYQETTNAPEFIEVLQNNKQMKLKERALQKVAELNTVVVHGAAAAPAPKVVHSNGSGLVSAMTILGKNGAAGNTSAAQANPAEGANTDLDVKGFKPRNPA